MIYSLYRCKQQRVYKEGIIEISQETHKKYPQYWYIK